MTRKESKMNKHTQELLEFIFNLNEVRDCSEAQGMENPTLELITNQTILQLEFNPNKTLDIKVFDISQENSEPKIITQVTTPIKKI